MLLMVMVMMMMIVMMMMMMMMILLLMRTITMAITDLVASCSLHLSSSTSSRCALVTRSDTSSSALLARTWTERGRSAQIYTVRQCVTSTLIFFYQASFSYNYFTVLKIYANPHTLVNGVTSQVCISSNNNTSNSALHCTALTLVMEIFILLSIYINTETKKVYSILVCVFKSKYFFVRYFFSFSILKICIFF